VVLLDLHGRDAEDTEFAQRKNSDRQFAAVALEAALSRRSQQMPNSPANRNQHRQDNDDNRGYDQLEF
jgi:hypothetical protein